MTTKEKGKNSKGRGRPRGFDVDSAIAVATDLFHRRGYDGVGIAELSEKIGISAPSLYAAFGNKRSLFERVLQQYVQSNSDWLLSALAMPADLGSVVKTLFANAAKTYSRDPKRPGCLALDGARNCCTEAQALTASCRQQTQELIRDRIATGAPELDDVAIDELSDYALMVLVGLSGSARDGMTREKLCAIAEIAATGFSQRLQYSLGCRDRK